MIDKKCLICITERFRVVDFLRCNDVIDKECLICITERFDFVKVRHFNQKRHCEDGEGNKEDEDHLEAGEVDQDARDTGEHQLAEDLHGGEERVVRGLEGGGD